MDDKTKRYRLASRIIIACTALFWAVYDVFPAINAGRGDTISENIRDWSRDWWIFPVISGALVSHFFLNVGQPENYKLLFYCLVGVVFLMMLLNVVTVYAIGWAAPPWFRGTALALGIVLGTVLWRQNP